MNGKIFVLKKIAHILNENNITWALGASMMLYFRNVTDTFHDIDLMVCNEDAIKTKEILSSIGVLQPQNPNSKYQTKEFLEYVIDDVDVDVMIDWQL